MRTHKNFIVFVTVLSLSYGCACECLAQVAASDLRKITSNIFAAEDFRTLSDGEPIVKLIDTTDRREIAVAGLARLQVPAATFLDSYQRNMTRKSDAAILEIGAFSDPPNLDDLASLTIDDRDIEDLKHCAVGDCKLKLSRSMIERFQKEVDWQASDYRVKTIKLFKQILLEYVSTYLSRGDAGLIHYDDKSETIELKNETKRLLNGSTFQLMADSLFREKERQSFPPVLVWSKVKFGLKPVISINQIAISKTVDQVLIVSKQIYATHYFESSIGLTAYVTLGGENPESYLFYENRSLLDGFGGPFGKIKRGFVEDGAVAGLKSFLSSSQASLNARNVDASNTAPGSFPENRAAKRRTRGRVYLLLMLIWTVAVIAMIREIGRAHV